MADDTAADTAADADTVQSRLQNGALSSLVSLVVDDLLTRPVSGLLDPDFVADQVIMALETASEGANTETWLREQIQGLRDRLPEGTLDDRAPDEVVLPLRDALGRPIVWDRELVGRLVDHDAIRGIFRDVLARALTGYARKLAQLGRDNPVSQAARNLGFGGRGRGTGRGSGIGSGLGRLMSLGEDLAKGLSAEIEAQTEGRTREFVDQAMSAVMQQVADHLCDPNYADLYGRYRVHLLDILLDTELSVLAGEADKIDPDQLVATGAAVARALSHREGFRDEIAGAVRSAITEIGDKSLRAFLVEAGIDEAQWRVGIEEQIVARGQDLLATTAFQDWLTALLS
ncbi:MAG: hypothetical protein GXP62_21675 [Oligoflexia bacterium]|nr:hypothetical protein [Oligoflexia bacterium]